MPRDNGSLRRLVVTNASSSPAIRGNEWTQSDANFLKAIKTITLNIYVPVRSFSKIRQTTLLHAPLDSVHPMASWHCLSLTKTWTIHIFKNKKISTQNVQSKREYYNVDQLPNNIPQYAVGICVTHKKIGNMFQLIVGTQLLYYTKKTNKKCSGVRYIYIYI